MVMFDYTQHSRYSSTTSSNLVQQTRPCFECLKHVLTSYTTRFRSIPLVERHNPARSIIRLPLNYYKYKSRQSGGIDETYEGEVRSCQYPWLLWFRFLIRIRFYQKLPKNIIINGILTTTNISIVVKTQNHLGLTE